MTPTRRRVLRSIGAGTAIVAVGSGVALGDDDTDDQGDGTTAEVRVGHLSPDTPAVDVYVGPPGLDPTDEDTDPAIPGLTYPNFFPGDDGGYLDFSKGTYDISVTPAGVPSVEAIDIDDFELEANRNYTVLAVGELAPETDDEPAISGLPLVDNGDDDTALPPADKTLVRFVHASPDAGEVDIAVKDGPTLVEDVQFGDASGYLEIDPGEYTLDVGPGALEVPFEAEAGTKVSAYVIGNATPEEGGDGPLGAEVKDEPLAAVTTLDATNPGGGDRGRGRGDD